jgi:hypothetical protein
MAGLFGDGWLDYRPTLDLGATAMVADEAVGIPLDTGGDILSAGGPPSPGAGPVDGEATAEWLEVRVTPPGGDAEVARRTIFDRLPADLRAAGQLDPGAVEPIDLVDPEGEDDHAYLPLLGDRVFAITTGATSIVDTLANARDGHAMLAIAFGGLRDRLVEAMALDAGARTFVASPNVVSVSMEVLGDGPVPIVRTGLDIWHRDDGVLPLTPSSTSAAEARILKGVADHVTERYVVDRLAHEVGSDAQPTGVGLVFEAAAAQGIPIRVLRDTIAEPLDVGPRARALIEKALDEGDVVLVPAAPVTIGDDAHIGWWRVDPATGTTTDVMDGGGGASAVAYGRLLGNLYRTAYVFCRGVGAAVAVSVIQASVMMHDGLTPKAAAYVAPGGAAGTVCTVVAAG